MSASYNLSSWMGDLRNDIGHLPINRLAIPGTHDSGTYNLNGDSALSPDEDDKIKKITDITGIISCVEQMTNTILAGWAKAQGINIYAQLNLGIRYLDLRVCYNADDDNFWIVHAQYSIHLDQVLSEVKQFLNEHPTEVVILDFNHFYEMHDDLHKRLHDNLYALFEGMFAFPVDSAATPTAPLTDLQKACGAVVIFYKDQPDANTWDQEHIESNFPNKQNMNDLKSYLTQSFASRSNKKMHVFQAILTEDTPMIAKGLIPGSGNPGTLIELAYKTVDPAVMPWIRNKELGLTTNYMNILILDAVLNDHTSTAIINLNFDQAKRWRNTHG